MKRRRILARETAFKALFQLDFGVVETDEKEIYENLAVENAIEESTEDSDDELQEENLTYIVETVKNVMAHREEIDAVIKKYLRENWTLNRLATADRNILRLAVYELAEKKVPTGVAINEAVELAKKYGTDDSARFVNGILDAIAN
ncbi:MAG: transcription antitermination factor NusB [Selenomonadaceae bacterium]|nr:transcription antitermination factor NusB [Selenomonadaceae bacterium]